MSIKTILTTVGTKIKVHSPAILLVTGIVAVVGGTVAACVATTKLEPVVDKAKEDLDLIRDREAEGALKEGEAPKLKTQCYLRTAAKVTYLYSIPAAMVIGGLVCVGVSHRIISGRCATAMAGWQATMTAFNKYRRNVVTKYGREVDYDLYNDNVNLSDDQKRELVHEDGVVKAERDVPWHADIDRCFDEGNLNWSKDVYANQAFLACSQNHINDILRSRRKEKVLKNGVVRVIPGHITAREVYEELGWTRGEDYRKQDLYVGKMTDGACDPSQPDFLDLGVFESDDTGALQFVNGEERSVWLHPNFDGVIIDKIGVPLYFKDGKRCDKNGNYI